MEIQERVKSYEEAMLNNLATLVSYNSVQGEPQPNAPFGEIPAACLDKALEARGLQTNHDFAKGNDFLRHGTHPFTSKNYPVRIPGHTDCALLSLVYYSFKIYASAFRNF